MNKWGIKTNRTSLLFGNRSRHHNTELEKGKLLIRHPSCYSYIQSSPNWFNLIWLILFNATFINIWAISWRPVLLVEETRVPEENHRLWPTTGILYHLRLGVKCTLFCNLQSQARTHAVFVIDLYELLCNPTHWVKSGKSRGSDRWKKTST